MTETAGAPSLSGDGRDPAAPAGAGLGIRGARAEDAAPVARIYNHYVNGTTATFETEAVHPAVMADRMAQCRSTGLPWLVAERQGRLLGYAYAVRWKPRHAYRYSCETTIYLDAERTGHGIGIHLYGALLNRLRTSGWHTAIGGIALPNPASVALHERLGFRKVAHFSEVGYKLGRWIDVGYWQRIFGPDE